ncbi:MAG TPA: glycosyltransferase 87 family protein [Thermoleophilaceae bacterium]|nr:glycosyltransferase 87 family protein [Thermoleophilaceae bacterium]
MTRAASALLLGAFALTFLDVPWGDERVSDLFLYRTYAAGFLDGALPYRDVSFEYPPLAAPLLALPGLAGTAEGTYRIAFGLLALALALAVVLMSGELSRRTGGDRRTAMLAVAAMPLLTGAMVRTHFDLAPVALMLAALLLLCADRPRAGFAILGVGVMMKGFPLVVAPVAVAWLVARGERRAALSGVAALVLSAGAIAAVAVMLSPSGALAALTYHLDRPVQIESSPASLLLALDAVGVGEVLVVKSHRSDGLLHAADGPVAALFSVALLAAIACAGAAAGRGGPPTRRALVLGSLAAVVAFAGLGKVLSPQFLIWVVPLTGLALAWRMPALAAAGAAATVLTLVEFPAHYGDVVAREPAWLWLVAVRNVLLLAVLALALRTLLVSPLDATAGAAARPRWRGRHPRPRPAPR